MQTNYSSFEQGEIVVADILFSAQIGLKRRPVLVISNYEFNSTSDDIIVLKITSTSGRKTKYDISLKQIDLENGEIKSESFIMADFPVTIEKSLISQKIGNISKQKLSEVKKMTKILYDL